MGIVSGHYYDTSQYKVLANLEFPSYSLRMHRFYPLFFGIRSYDMVRLGI